MSRSVSHLGSDLNKLPMVKKFFNLLEDPNNAQFEDCIAIINAIKSKTDQFSSIDSAKLNILISKLDDFFVETMKQENLKQLIAAKMILLDIKNTMLEKNLESKKPVSQSEIVSSSMDHTAKVPNEILIETFSYLTSKEKMNVAQVCRRFNTLSNNASLWNQFKPNLLIKDLKSYKRALLLNQQAEELENKYQEKIAKIYELTDENLKKCIHLFSKKEVATLSIETLLKMLYHPQKMFIAVVVHFSKHKETLTEELVISTLKQSNCPYIALTFEGAIEFLNQSITLYKNQLVICELSLTEKNNKLYEYIYSAGNSSGVPCMLTYTPHSPTSYPLEAIIQGNGFKGYWTQGENHTLEFTQSETTELVNEEGENKTCSIM